MGCLVENGVCQHCGLHLPESDWCDREPGFKLNAEGTVAVATDTYCSNDMSACPRGCKVYLIGRGGVGHLAIYDGDPFWIEWASVPKRAKK